MVDKINHRMAKVGKKKNNGFSHVSKSKNGTLNPNFCDFCKSGTEALTSAPKNKLICKACRAAQQESAND